MTSLNETIGCTLLGFYCLPCKTALKKENVRQHLRRYHKLIVDSMPKDHVRRFISSTAQAAATRSIESCLEGPFKKGFECSLCLTFCSRKYVFDRHVKNGICNGAEIVPVSYRDTLCFRQHVLRSLPTPSNTLVDTASSFTLCRKQLQSEDHSVQHTCAIALAITNEDINFKKQEVPDRNTSSRIMKSFVRDDESPEMWAVHFECLMGGGAANFEAKIRQLVSW